MTKKTDSERATIIMRKVKGHLVPAHSFDAECLASLTEGADIEVTLKQRRSLPAMRRYWAILADVVAAVDDDRYPTAERLHDALKLATGYVETFHDLTGKEHIRADSIAFSRMDEAEFRGFQARAFRLLRTTFGIDPENLGRMAA